MALLEGSGRLQSVSANPGGDRSPLIEPLRAWDPERIGGYGLIGRLGAGAMGQIYLGRSAAGRLVAVKTIRIEFAEEPDFRTRFAHEVVAARRVSGAFTAPVVAADAEADVPWLATAYVPAPPLSTLVQACGPLPVPAVRWLAAGCAEALESIHGAGLIHRDLKPSNVLVSPDGPRVIDFGLARAVERIQLTMTRGAVGTPAYMAPEQARDTRQATTASDVYSLGATILYAATGHGPYQGDSVMDVLVHLATEPPDLSGLPPDLADVVMACLQRDPRRRPTSASVLAYLASGGTDPAAGDFSRVPLSASALALIEQYRGDPLPVSQPGRAGNAEDTFGSAPEPISQPPAPSASATRPDGDHRRGVLIGLGVAFSSMVLVAAGIALGTYLGSSRAASAASSPSPHASASPSSTAPTLPSGPGAFTRPPTAGPGRAKVVMSQQQGDPLSSFVVEGRHWPPGSLITVSLAGVRHSRVHDFADGVGAFNYVINQGHRLFGDGFPLGSYKVVVRGLDGLHATATFTVIPPPPPGGPPPPGPPPGQ
jgi:serine/threonine protein kinase